jgi:hypothetical protein
MAAAQYQRQLTCCHFAFMQQHDPQPETHRISLFGRGTFERKPSAGDLNLDMTTNE